MTNDAARDRSRVPIAATCSLLITISFHVWATITGLITSHWIGPADWALLACSELLLLAVVLHRPERFRMREFRLPGVMVVSITLILLAPLAGVMRQYGEQVPRTSVISIAAGVAMTALVFAVPQWRSESARPSHEPQRTTEHGIVLAIVAVAVIVFPIWVRSLSSVPLFELLGGGRSGIELAQSRDQAFLDLPSLPLRVTVAVVRNLYLLFAIAWLVSDWVTTSRAEWQLRSKRRIVATAAVATAAAYAVVTTERAILGEVAVIVAIAALVASRKMLSARLVLVVAPLALAFPLVFGVFATVGTPAQRVDAAIESVRRRIFFLPSDVMVHYFTAFPARRDFLHGSSIPKIPRLFGTSTVDLSAFVYDTYYRVSDSLNGIANGSYLGVGWANFGILGVVLWSGAAAGAVIVLERVISQLPTRSSAALRAVAVIQVGFLTSVDVFRSVLGFAPGFLDLVLLAWFLVWLDRRRSYRTTVAASALSDEGVAVPS